MRVRLSLGTALVLASCAPQHSAVAPEPRPAPPPVVAEPQPVVAAPALPAPAPTPVPTDTLTPLVPVERSDSLALAKQARDSALDANVLDALATARPPDAVSPDEGDAAAWRALFDIDVANWMDHHRVKYYLDLFTGPVRERMGIWLTRMPAYEPTMRAQLIAKGLPGDLAYLPLIESGYSATAVSRARAVGMWQFMRGTARLYGLRVDNWVDERRDVVKSTTAAIRFLADLTAKFGSPYLAAAAYNGGPGRIQRGLRRIEGYDPASDDLEDPEDDGPQPGDAAFFQLADTRHIMRETKDYVPKLIAAAMIAKQPVRYGFPAIMSASGAPLDSVVVSEPTGLDVVARLADVPLADLWALNPAFLRAVTPPSPNQRAVIRVPAGRGAEAQAALDLLPATERLSGFAHHAKRGETLTRIASRYGVRLAELRSLNPQYKARAPKTGEVVRIPGSARLSGWIAENRRVVTEPERASGSVHRVKRGETLSHLSRRYGVSVAKLRAWNRLGPSAVIRIGQTLRVRAPAASASQPARTSSGGTAAKARAGAAAKVHIVKAGDTLFGLARRYGTTVPALLQANRLAASRPLLVGQRLTIPS